MVKRIVTKILLALGAAILLPATPQVGAGGAAAQPIQTQDVITVGLFDERGTGADVTAANVEFTYQSFHPEGMNEAWALTAAGITHGDSVAMSAIDEARKIDAFTKIRVISAGVFYTDPADPKGLRKFSAAGAERALAWFKANNVKVISMAFLTQDTPELRALVAKARAEGFILVAGTPNASGGSNTFPAAYDGVISVAGIAAELPTQRGEMTWATIATSGEVFFERGGKTIREFGSSMATGRIAGALAAYAFLEKGLDNVSAITFLRGSSSEQNLARGYWKTVSKTKMNVYATTAAKTFIANNNGANVTVAMTNTSRR